MRDPRTQQWMAAQDLRVRFPTEGLSPRPPLKPLLPSPPDAPVELPQTAVVRWAAVVLVVAAELRVEDGLLLVHGVMPMRAAPFPDGLERPRRRFFIVLTWTLNFPRRSK